MSRPSSISVVVMMRDGLHQGRHPICHVALEMQFDALPEVWHRTGQTPGRPDGLKVELVDGAELGHALDVGGAPLEFY